MKVDRAERVVQIADEQWPLGQPFRIAGHVFAATAVVVATISADGFTGRGEAAGVYYLGDDVVAMHAGIASVRDAIEAGLSREALQRALRPGGARNALDCALWALEAQTAGCEVWQLAGLPPPRPLATTFTIGIDAPEAMALAATGFAQAKMLKLKLSGEGDADVARVRAVRRARPDAWVGVDANQGYTPATLDGLIGALVECGVKLLEQPFARGREADMVGLNLPLPTAADESCLDLEELERLPGLFDFVNIKLDKCGGLTEALAIAARARQLGLKLMVGNMTGSSLAMAPGFVVGQLCDLVDLDGPILLARDRVPAVRYVDGFIDCPPGIWPEDRGDAGDDQYRAKQPQSRLH